MRGVVIGVALLLSACTSNGQPQTTSEPTSEPTATTSAPPREKPWDPRDVDDLPAAGAAVAPGLPARVDPPDTASLLETKPLDAAVLSVDRRGGRIQLLGLDGSWRELRLPNDDGRLALSRGELSPDGTRLAALLDDGIEVWHLPTGTRTMVPLPAGYVPWDYAWVDWIGRSTLLLDDYVGGGWRIDIGSGAAERTPFPRWLSGWTVDDDGAVVEVAESSEKPALLDWSDGAARRVAIPGIGHLQWSAVRGGQVVGTTYDYDRGFALVSFDRTDPTTADRLPVRDFEGNYSNWAMRAVAVLDDGSALFKVAVPAVRSEKDGWRLVRWVPGSDGLEVVTTSEADPTEPMTFADDLL